MTTKSATVLALVAGTTIAAWPALAADVTPDRLANPDKEPQNWLMNHRTYDAQRYSPLARINKDTVKNLKLAYAVPIGGTAINENLQSTPLVEDGYMYVVDQWGIPVLRFHWKWSDNEIKMAKDMQETYRAIIEAAGGTYITTARVDAAHPYGIADGGVIIHEVGAVRMGEHRTTSALNSFCQAHDVKNLFVTDGACFVTNADKNPTLTIMAVAWRAADHILASLRRKEL